MKLNKGHNSSGIVIIRFWDKPDLERNFKNLVNVVILCK